MLVSLSGWRKTSIRSSSAALLLLTLPAPALAQQTPLPLVVPAPEEAAQPAALPFAGLTVLPARRATISPGSTSTRNQAEANLGRLSLLDTPRLQATFRLRNDSPQPLTLARMQPSCRCTHARLVLPAPAGRKELTDQDETFPPLAPGQTALLAVTVDLAQEGAAPGPLAKSVSLYLTGQTAPAAIVTISATLLPGVTFTPAALDFGSVRAGLGAIKTLTVRADVRLAPGGVFPTLLSSDPDLMIRPMPTVPENKPGEVNKSGKENKAGETKAVKNVVASREEATSNMTTGGGAGDTPSGFLERRYEILVSPRAGLGPITGALSLAPTADLPPETLAVLSQVSASLSGTVRGSVSALPAALSFGTMAPGDGATRTLQLVGERAEAFTNIQVGAGAPWLTVKSVGLPPSSTATSAKVSPKVGPVQGAKTVPPYIPPAAAVSLTLEVTLLPTAPRGLLRTQVKVRLANGERLFIPITAYIGSAPGR